MRLQLLPRDKRISQYRVTSVCKVVTSGSSTLRGSFIPHEHCQGQPPFETFRLFLFLPLIHPLLWPSSRDSVPRKTEGSPPGSTDNGCPFCFSFFFFFFFSSILECTRDPTIVQQNKIFSIRDLSRERSIVCLYSLFDFRYDILSRLCFPKQRFFRKIHFPAISFY